MGRESRRKEVRRRQRIEDALFGPDQRDGDVELRKVSDLRLAVEGVSLGVFVSLSALAALPLELGPDVIALRWVGYGGVWAAGLYGWFVAKRRRNRLLERAWWCGLAIWAIALPFLF